TMFAGAALACAAACSSAAPADTGTPSSYPSNSGTGDPFDVPIDGVTHEQVLSFYEGDELFGLALRDYDGLGPLYTRTSCGACHSDATRGPGLVQKMSVVEADGVTASPDQSKLPYGNTVHPLMTAGATTPIVPPVGDSSIKVTTRIGPPV